MRRQVLPFLFCSTTMIAVYGGVAFADMMVTSGRDPSLAINAWDGAQQGTVLRLNNACRPDNPDCTWKIQSSGSATGDRPPGVISYTCTTTGITGLDPHMCSCSGTTDCFDLGTSGNCKAGTFQKVGVDSGTCTYKNYN